jgi:hypothetical protein
MPGAARSADLSRSTLADVGANPVKRREAYSLPPPLVEQACAVRSVGDNTVEAAGEACDADQRSPLENFWANNSFGAVFQKAQK